MKKYNKLFLLLLFVSVAFVSCNDNDDTNPNNNNGNFAENFGNSASRDFIGQIVNEDNDPIQNATVKIGSSTVQTDANGGFIIEDANVYEHFAYVKVTKGGYLDGSRSLVPTTGKNKVKIMMLAANVVATVNSGAASEATLPNGTKVTFDGGFKTEAGVPYSGSVNVMMHHLNPDDPNVADKMPGMLLAENETGNAGVLSTFGMMNVELRGSGNQKLQLSGTAGIEMPVAASQTGTAPATIPLWHFDETGGYWKEDGVATRQGNKYVGEVSHFSWWNCDTFESTVDLTITIVDGSGEPISNVGVGLVTPSGFTSYTLSTSNNGQVAGLIPANTTLTLNLYDVCGGLISTSQIGPFAVDTNLPTITLTGGLVQTTQVIGTLLQCDGSDVTSGYVQFSYGNGQSQMLPVTNGNFSFTTLVCNTSATFSLQGYDFANLQATDSISYTFAAPITNVGSLSTCNTVSEFITYQVDNDPVVYVFTNISASYGNSGQSNGLTISGYNPTQSGVYIWGNSNVPGTYSTTQFSIEGGDVGYVGNNTTNTLSFVLSNFGAVGEFIDMTINGTFDDTNGTHTYTATIHVIRDN